MGGYSRVDENLEGTVCDAWEQVIRMLPTVPVEF